MNLNFRNAVFTIVLILSFNLLWSQTESDSLIQARFDSLAKIPFTIKSLQADETNILNEIDTNNSLLHSKTEKGIQLNNYFSPQFHLANVHFNERIYNHGINSLHFGMSGFDKYTFLLPNKPIAEISTHRGRAFSNSQAGFGDNFDIHLIFAENFRNRLLWNFSYDKESYKGIYTNGKQKNTLFTTGIQYSGKKDKLHINVLYLDERHRMENNWGISSDTIFSDPNFTVRESALVNISTATTTIDERSIGFNADFPILSKIEVLKPVLYLKSFYTDYTFQYSDPSIDSSAKIYKSFWIDSHSIQHILKQKVWTNSLGIRLFYSDKIESKFGGRYESTIFDHDTLDTKYNIYQLELAAKYQLNNNLNFDGIAYLKILRNSSSPDINLSLQIKNQKYVNCKLSVFLKSDPIPYIYKSLVLNKTFHWQNNFENKFIKESGFAITLNTNKYLHSEINLSWSNYSNFIYLDTLSFPTEISNINKFNFHIHLPLSWKRLQFNSRFNYELFNPDPGHFSGWNSSHRLSTKLSLFKKVVNAEIGASILVYDYKHKFNFNPIIQLFHASEIPNDLIYSVGMFMYFQVSDFKFLIDVDNLDSFWLKERPSLVRSYPIYDFFFKFGLQWKFLN